MELGLEGKVAVVLASTAGLGLASARALLCEGARVAISGRDPERLARARDELARLAPERVLADQLDVTDSAALREHLRGVQRAWGSVQVLVTNAGGPPPGQASDTTVEDLDRAYALTLRSAIEAIQVVLPWMRAQRWGRIVAMTSLSVRQPIPDLALSNALRAGLTGWLKTLSQEVARDGVLVNSICTGMFMTDRLVELLEIRARERGTSLEDEKQRMELEIPVRRIGDPAEFGATAAFIVSEKASFLNGVALSCDGGATRGLL